jgi:glycosyltransferase involved in cell wall biosynthesis
LLPKRFKALLVGWGPLQQRLLEMANRLIPGRFAITKATRCLGDYYQAMDCMCMVSREEGYSLVVLEAMMSERPVIATPVGSVPELIEDRVTGVVITGTPQSVRDAALLLETHPAWARGLAKEAKSLADEIGHARTMARKYEDLLHRIWQEKMLRHEPACAANGSILTH